jgi:hypothetical protein
MNPKLGIDVLFALEDVGPDVLRMQDKGKPTVFLFPAPFSFP